MEPLDAVPSNLGDPAAWEALREQIIQRTGWDLHQFKENYLKRRVTARVRALGLERWSDYGPRLQDPQELEKLRDRLTVNVTEFFRDADVWSELEQSLLPKLAKEAAARPVPEMRIWSAGCSSGEEPYSLAILALEAAAQQRPKPVVRILASDLDEAVLAKAKAGRYPAASMAGVSPERLSAHFLADGQSWVASPQLRESIVFRRHNLFADPPPPELDLVLCRNVMIYFSRDLQQKLLRGFHAALRPGGYFVTGKTETVLGPVRSLWKPVSARARVFQRA
jgi:chemotaxis methyl-accepting protein methylase